MQSDKRTQVGKYEFSILLIIYGAGFNQPQLKRGVYMEIKASKDLIKTIIIIVLCIALVGETVALVMTKLPSDSDTKNRRCYH